MISSMLLVIILHLGFTSSGPGGSNTASKKWRSFNRSVPAQ